MNNNELKSKETINIVTISGQLVKKDLEIKEVDVKDDKGNVTGKDKAIMGSLILRTADGSEHEVTYYSYKTTVAGGESKIFKGLETGMTEFKDLEHNPEDADYIRVGLAKLTINDYKGTDGEVKSYNRISAKFAHRLTPKELETEIMEAKFEATGVIEKMEDEVIKEVVTGNVKVTMNLLDYDCSIIPVTFHAMKDLA